MLSKLTILVHTYGKNPKGLDYALQQLEEHINGYRGYRDVVLDVCKKCLQPLAEGCAHSKKGEKS